MILRRGDNLDFLDGRDAENGHTDIAPPQHYAVRLYFSLYGYFNTFIKACQSAAGRKRAGCCKPAQSQGENQAADVFAPNIEERTEEMRGVWVPYMSLSMSGETDRSEAAFRAKFQQIIDVSKEKRMNTLIVHVRPFSDALYRSELFPWSHILTGTQGQDPGYDPLAIMCEMAHAADMEIHAWVNPLRIQVNGTPEELCEDNIFNVCKGMRSARTGLWKQAVENI